jgi:DNA-binding MarR family transcriptional regulator
MMTEELNQTLVRFCRALGDRNRLRIVGLLADRPRTGEDLCNLLGVRAPTVSHHLKRLMEAGLVSAVPEQYYRVYSLREDTLLETVRTLSDRQALREMGGTAPYYGFEAKVLRDFLEEGRLKTIPRQRKKREIILRHLWRQFDPGQSYSEKDVNEILARYHEDVAFLRREMVSYGLLSRSGGEYRSEEQAGAGAPA